VDLLRTAFVSIPIAPVHIDVATRIIQIDMTGPGRLPCESPWIEFVAWLFYHSVFSGDVVHERLVKRVLGMAESLLPNRTAYESDEEDAPGGDVYVNASKTFIHWPHSEVCAESPVTIVLFAVMGLLAAKDAHIASTVSRHTKLSDRKVYLVRDAQESSVGVLRGLADLALTVFRLHPKTIISRDSDLKLMTMVRQLSDFHVPAAAALLARCCASMGALSPATDTVVVVGHDEAGKEPRAVASGPAPPSPPAVVDTKRDPTPPKRIACHSCGRSDCWQLKSQ
jgi:hypothetical protein